jgi:uncharacterized cupredoxin-like copper-binding protein
VVLLVAALGLLSSACSRSSPTLPPSAHSVTATLRDFRISASATTVRSGIVVFHVHNDAPVTHEFVLVRTDDPATNLPLGIDGLSVDEDAVQSVGEISEVAAGEITTLSVHLTPGHYVVFCNLEGHYLGGMRAGIEVTET